MGVNSWHFHCTALANMLEEAGGRKMFKIPIVPLVVGDTCDKYTRTKVTKL